MDLGEYRDSLQEAKNPTGEIYIWLLLIFSAFFFFLYFSCCNYFVSINFFPFPKVVWSVSLPLSHARANPTDIHLPHRDPVPLISDGARPPE